MALLDIPAALKQFADGKPLVVVDDYDRENEGDLVIAAERITPELINFMRKECGGLICLALTPERCDQLRLPQQTSDNSSRHHTAFTVSIEASRGVSTGISAHDRAMTIKTAIAPDTTPDDIARPGHIFPIRARAGGVLMRAGHTEAAVDLARLSSLNPAGVICEIMNPDGSMARLPDLENFSKMHGFGLISIADLIAYRSKTESLVTNFVSAEMPTRHANFKVYLFESPFFKSEPLALTLGDIRPGFDQTEPALVRVHSECLTGESLGSLRCDCGAQLDAAQAMIAAEGKGAIIYLRQEGRGIGLPNKIRAYHLQDRGADTVEANEMLGFKPDLRDYGEGAQILKYIGIRKMRLITNNPRKLIGLEGHGLEIVERVPLVIPANSENRRYLDAKKNRMGHLI
ncbi:MAG: bifunctional 3,4-dihydroxy-2-butanone-4-phosphate synthase/GTP cyclohydrolase II [Planctomycetota bacterium]